MQGCYYLSSLGILKALDGGRATLLHSQMYTVYSNTNTVCVGWQSLFLSLRSWLADRPPFASIYNVLLAVICHICIHHTLSCFSYNAMSGPCWRQDVLLRWAWAAQLPSMAPCNKELGYHIVTSYLSNSLMTAVNRGAFLPDNHPEASSWVVMSGPPTFFSLKEYHQEDGWLGCY